MATKSHKWEGEQLVITVSDGPAAGEYRPKQIIVTMDGLLQVGMLQGKLIKAPVADFPGLQREIKERADRAWEAAKLHKTHCDRCEKMTEGTQTVWAKKGNDRVCRWAHSSNRKHPLAHQRSAADRANIAQLSGTQSLRTQGVHRVYRRTGWRVLLRSSYLENRVQK
jgi:hypothetical protein